MKVRFKHVWWILGFVAVVSCAYAVLRLFRPPPEGPELVNQTRQKLRAMGFKTDLAEFDLSTSPDMRTREATLTAATPDLYGGFMQYPQLMDFDNDSAIIVWKLNDVTMTGGGGRASWDDARTYLNPNKDNLDAACDAILSGPIGFNLNTADGNMLRLPHLQMLHLLAGALAWRTLMALHDGDNNSAWTNLLALTRVVTAWKIEPVEISYLVRSSEEDVAFDATWQALQTYGWQDSQLKQLQNEWESANLLENLPELAAFKRAATLAQFQMLQQEMIKGGPGMGLPVGQLVLEALHHPSYVWPLLRAKWRQNEFLHGGIYQNEVGVLNYYRDLEVAMRKATNASNWLQIRAVPGITNEIDFSVENAFFPAMSYRPTPRPRLENTFLDRLAEDEAKRGILITAIALERYHEKRGSYPDALTDLAPGFVKKVPADFMSGRSLRYRRTGDGHFVLYSVGLVGTDNGGRVAFSALPVRRAPGYGYGHDRVDPTGNIVWPPPATQAAAQAAESAELDTQAQKEDEQEETAAAAQWYDTAQQQMEAAKLLAAPPQSAADVKLDGVPLSTRLCNTDTAGTNHLTLTQLLTLRQVITGQEPEIITFKLPIQYNALNQIGRLALLVDANNDNSPAQQAELSEANDGDCLMAWNTIYETPGLHALRLDLSVNQLQWLNNGFRGPVLPYTISNLCQFSLASAQFDPAVGAIIHAKLQEMNCKYAVELTTTNGAVIKRFTGSTSDGIIKLRWDLTGDNGSRFTNNEFNSLYHITLTDSRRSQTLRGP